MPHEIDLKVEPRTTVGKGMGALRRSGFVPANVYGPGMKSIPIQVTAKAFHSVIQHATPTTMINLTVGSETEPRSVYLQKVQWQFVKREPFHLDFYAINLKRLMHSAIRLTFVGEAPAAKLANVKLAQPISQVHVEGLPHDMPESIEVDLSSLVELDQAIHARDLKLPPGVTMLDDPDELIARVQMLRGAVEEVTEEEEAPLVGSAPPAATSA
ncbi:MAG TPA: 50S ribosomal protein L25 [Chloroflexota bacterium]|nr:50S ribosomal protein L25 [Chloroflexota bacterium]